ncbi:hypothetical protein DdX_16622 [Ditylenchus destructor]|uniref:Uncharacterized protein n=1 Tax=Ditylenchus destructor TaxID=166010 RepID=A0AAD4MSV8_9BILA|nr:hypothetical protein DdX_16622 [Ditylenchus destructor]
MHKVKQANASHGKQFAIRELYRIGKIPPVSALCPSLFHYALFTHVWECGVESGVGIFIFFYSTALATRETCQLTTITDAPLQPNEEISKKQDRIVLDKRACSGAYTNGKDSKV